MATLDLTQFQDAADDLIRTFGTTGVVRYLDGEGTLETTASCIVAFTNQKNRYVPERDVSMTNTTTKIAYVNGTLSRDPVPGDEIVSNNRTFEIMSVQTYEPDLQTNAAYKMEVEER